MNQDRKDQVPANRPENKEPAEGSRDTVGATDNAGGITNRPLDREEREQEEVPPRGRTKEEALPEDDATLKTKI
jgi:hypothetical protein